MKAAFSQTITSDDTENSQINIQEEIKALQENGTFELVQDPKAKKKKKKKNRLLVVDKFAQ